VRVTQAYLDKCAIEITAKKIADLSVEHLGLAGQIAGKISKRVPPHVDQADLYQDACRGLLEAAMRYDRGTGVPFGAYARRRIEGAVLDGLRRADYLRRHTRDKVKRGEAEDAGAPLSLKSPDRLPGRFERPDTSAARAESGRLVRQAISGLPERLQVIVMRYYFCDETMLQIGSRLGVNESRVSQLHKRAVSILRVRMVGSGIDRERT
jgi:RNA polymerase sigma factor for flagellar operon FliA